MQEGRFLRMDLYSTIKREDRSFDDHERAKGDRSTVGPCLSPSDAALRMVRLLPGLGQADRIPADLDVERLAACLGFHVRGGAMRGNDYGMLCRPREITIERFTYGPARRFTVAHMLAHLLLHPDRPVDVEHGVLCHVRDFGPDATGEERWANPNGGYHDNVNIRRKDGTVNESIRRIIEDRHAMRADKFCWWLDAQRSGSNDGREEDK